MATIDELTPEQIKTPEIFQKIKELGDSLIMRSQAKEAYFLQEKLSTLLSSTNLPSFNPELYKNYQDLLTSLKWTAFTILPDETNLELLSNQFIAVLDNEDINTQDKIEAKLFTKGLFPRNEFRQKMHGALNENKEILGNKTFGEWLKDYSKKYDFRDRDDLTPSRYVNQDLKDETLSEAEKNKLKKALQIFDKTLLITPVMSEPLLSMAIRAMIKGGVIKEQINPALLRPSPTPVELPKIAEEKIPVPQKIIQPAPAPVIIKEPEKPVAPKSEPKPESKKEVEPKIAKPGLFEKWFGKSEKSTEGPEKKLEKEKAETVPEKETIFKEIPTFTEKTEAPAKPEQEPLPEPTLQPKQPQLTYKIRTMKDDIERAKKQTLPTEKQPAPIGRQAIPPKPTPKVVKNNIVDLSGK